MQNLKQSSTAKPLVFAMWDSSDPATPKTGLSPTVTLSKNGGSFASPSGAVTEIANGLYKVAGNATDTNTLGVLALYATATGAKPSLMAYNVVAFDPDSATNLGLLYLDAAVSSRNATTPPTASAVASQVRTELTTELGRIDASISSRSTYAGGDTSGTTTLLARLTATRAGLLDNLDAAITTRLAASGYTAPDNADIATLISRITADRAVLLDNLANLDATISSRLADADYSAAPTAAEIRAEIDANSTKLDVAVSSRNATAPDNAGIAAIKAKTDNLPASPAAASDVPTATSVASAVRTELTTELGRIDVAVSSVGGGGTAPTAEEVAAAVVDQTLSGHTAAGTVGGALQAAGNAGDPWSATNLDQYAAGTAGKLLNKLDVGEVDQPVYVAPGEPVDSTVCLVGGILRRPDSSLADNIKITVELIAPSTVRIEDGALVTFESFQILTDDDGRIFSDNGTDTPDPWCPVERNDKIIPAGSKYRLTCKELKLFGREVEFTTGTFDLASLVV